MTALPYEGADFIDLHVETCGQTNVSPILHQWAALGALAALVQDRVGVSISRYRPPLSLAQFVVLVAASGAGKGQAISRILELVEQTFIREHLLDGTILYQGATVAEQLANERGYQGLHIYPGTLTRAATQDLLHNQTDPQTQLSGHAKFWWVAEEMSFCFGALTHASEVIKLLVAYKEKSPIAHQAMTRKDAVHRIIKDPCINILAGSTWEWLGSIMTKADATGGLLRRTHFVEVPYDITKKTLKEVFPSDVPARRAVLCQRIRQYAMQFQIPGECLAWRPEAWKAFNDWFESETQDVPSDPAQYTLHGNRDSETAKLAALSAISRWDYRVGGELPQIAVADVERAVRWWKQAYETAPKLWLQTGGNTFAKNAETAANVLETLAKKLKGEVPEMVLAKTLATSSFAKRDVDDAVMTLLQRGWVTRTMNGSRMMLQWRGRG